MWPRRNNEFYNPKHVIARGKVYNMPVNLFFDTGATTSLVSTRVIHHLGLAESIKRTNSKITGLSNKIVPMRGEIELEISFAGVLLKEVFIVCDVLDNDLLIGMNVMDKLEISIDLPGKIISTPFGVEKFFDKPLGLHKTHKIRCHKTVKLPPNSVCYINGKIGFIKPDCSYEGIIDPYYNIAQNKGIFVSKAMVYTDHNRVPISCANVTNGDVTIYKGQLLGFLEPFEKFESVHSVKDETAWNLEHQSRQYVYKTGDDHYDASMQIPRFVDDEDIRKINDKWTDVNILYHLLKVDDMKISEEQKAKLKALVSSIKVSNINAV